MLKGLGSLFGLHNSNENEWEEIKDEQMPDSDRDIQHNELNAEGDDGNKEESFQQFIQQQGLSGYFLSLASNATKKISESVSETAETIWRTVDQGSIDGIMDKTIIGAFHKEHKKFLHEKHKTVEAAVPPWEGFSEEETVQQLILALSLDRRNFLCDPPDGLQVPLAPEEMYPVALLMLQEDELLSQMRFALVPKHIKEDRFWRNYFYRVSLIKQSAQLKSLAPKEQEVRESESETDVIRPEDVHLGERKSVPPPITTTNEVEDDLYSSPGVSEFVSDAFDTCSFNPDDLRKEMRLALE